MGGHVLPHTTTVNSRWSGRFKSDAGMVNHKKMIGEPRTTNRRLSHSKLRTTDLRGALSVVRNGGEWWMLCGAK
jgi:hypothetical protein